MRTIKHTPGVCGGAACINNTRIVVWLIAQCWNKLHDLDAVCDRWVWDDGLTRDDILMALNYYDQHPDEIDAAIADNDRALAELQA